ncbi:MAG: hypothetical protein IJU40_05660 [Desulfovibrionaceae bacterium]|nr:hypothetical protein [Desulfovibrionaceae bacterium]
MFSAASRFLFYDGLSVLLLSLSLSLRALLAGEQLSGAVLTGFFCAMLWPLSREFLLKGSSLQVWLTSPLHISIMAGVFLALILARLPQSEKILSWLRVLSQALLCCFGFLCAQVYVSYETALLMALFLAIIPEFCCDIALGDMASFIHESYYILRAILGAMLTCLIYVYYPEDLSWPKDVVALSLGVLVPLSLQFFKPK